MAQETFLIGREAGMDVKSGYEGTGKIMILTGPLH